MKYKVLQLVGSFHQGGSERQALQLAALMAANKCFHVEIASLSPDGILRKHAESSGFTEIPSFPLTSFYDRNAALQTRRFVALLRERNIHIIQCHDFYTNVFGMLGSALARVPVRIAARRETSGVRTGLQKTAEKLAYQLAHAVVANSDAVKQTLIDDGVNAQRVVTIYNGFDLRRTSVSDDFDRDRALHQMSLPTSGRRFITIVANLRHSVKDHGTFLKAAQIVNSHVRDSAFLLVGEGELIPSMKQLAADLGISDHVFFIGRLENVNEVLALSEMGVLSSVAEGFPNAILEYMGAGKPVVATDVGGTREVVVDSETGFLVPPKDPETMAARIIELLNDRARASKMGELGKQLVEAKFSCEAQLKNTESLYDQLLSRQKDKVVAHSQKLDAESV